MGYTGFPGAMRYDGLRTESPSSELPQRKPPVCRRAPSQRVVMPLSLNIGKCTLLGNYRENNEDAIDVKPFPELTVCIVADGMGGQQAGEVASKKAIDIIPREERKNLTPHLNAEGVKGVMRRAIV